MKQTGILQGLSGEKSWREAGDLLFIQDRPVWRTLQSREGMSGEETGIRMSAISAADSKLTALRVTGQTDRVQCAAALSAEDRMKKKGFVFLFMLFALPFSVLSGLALHILGRRRVNRNNRY